MQVQVLLVGKLVVVPGVHPLVEQVHLDVRGGLRCIFVDGAACTLVPWCICFDLALGARSSKHLTAANPRGLVRLCEGYDHVRSKVTSRRVQAMISALRWMDMSQARLWAPARAIDLTLMEWLYSTLVMS